MAYLRYKKEADRDKLGVEAIDAALHLYWLDHMENAPTSEILKHHLQEEQEYMEAIHRDADEENR